MDNKKSFELKLTVAAFILILLLVAAATVVYYILPEEPDIPAVTLENGEIPEFAGEPYVELYGNQPQFDKDDITAKSFERYSPLDELKRCGTAVASVGRDLMPTEARESIGSVKPSGWKVAKYDIVNGNYLYNRCHLIGFQLTGENANERNLITGTRYLNVDGMLPFENMVADYVKETGNHVMYRVTPVFVGDEPVARGVIMEGYSVEDDGDGICFNVYCFNEQPGIEIDHATGDSRLVDKTYSDTKKYVVNTGSKKFHLPECSSVSKIAKENKETFTGTREDLILRGLKPCGECKP